VGIDWLSLEVENLQMGRKPHPVSVRKFTLPNIVLAELFVL